jgi:hypothetical protein
VRGEVRWEVKDENSLEAVFMYLARFQNNPCAAVSRNPDFVSQFHLRVAGVSVIHFRVVRRVLSCGRAGPRGAMCQRRGRPWA